MNPWLFFSLLLLGVWTVIFALSPSVRKEMFWVSLFTMPFGLTEPIFVPEYWSPPSLLNLAEKTGFDIESLIFSFAVGGIGSVLYETFNKTRHQTMPEHERHSRRHRLHLVALGLPFVIVLCLLLFTALNPIYSASLGMFAGGIAAILCRPDLKKKIWIGGILFWFLYFVFFVLFNIVHPGLVLEIWNLESLSGVLILGVPLEELLFAITFGMMWSSVYEHFTWSSPVPVSGILE